MASKRRFVYELQRNVAPGQNDSDQYLPPITCLENNILDLVKPVDYETFLSKNKVLLDNDVNRDLVYFPLEDVKCDRIPRFFRTLNNSVPDNATELYEDNLLAKQCIAFFTTEWYKISYRHDTYAGPFHQLPQKKENELPSIFPEQKFEMDLDDTNEDLCVSVMNRGDVCNVAKLAVCSLDEYKSFMQAHENHLASSGGSTRPTSNGSFIHAAPSLKDYSLRQLTDGTWILAEAKPAIQTSRIYLDCVVKATELGQQWIMLHMQDHGNNKYLYTGSKEQNTHWMSLLNKVLQKQQSADLRSFSSMTSSTSFDGNENGSPLSRPDYEYETVRVCLQRYIQENESNISHNRSKDRTKLLALYPDIRTRWDNQLKRMQLNNEKSKSVQPINPKTFTPFPLRPEVCRRYIVTFHHLKLGLQASIGPAGHIDNPEPLFLSACLIHVGEGRRISEDFHWDPNSCEVSKLLSSELFCNRWSPSSTLITQLSMTMNSLKKCNSCIFTTAYPEEEVYILVRVDKVLQTSVSSIADRYIKSGGDGKAGAQILKTMSVYCKNVGHYRQPFAWSARVLNGRDLSMRFYKHDASKLSEDDIIKCVQNLARTDRPYRGTGIPMSCQISVQEYRDNYLLNEKDPSSSYLQSYSSMNDDSLILSHQLIPLPDGSATRDETLSQFVSDEKRVVREVCPFLYDPQRQQNALRDSTISNTGGSLGTVYSNVAGNSSSLPSSNFGHSGLAHASFSSGYAGSNSFNTNTASSAFNGNSFPLECGARRSRQHCDEQSSPEWDIAGESSNAGNDMLTQGKPKAAETLVCPHMEYENAIFIYPKSLNFSNQNAFPRARNLACFVELRDSDDPETALPFKAVYTRPSLHQEAYDSWANTIVSYHDTSPSFHDEVKINLQVRLSEKSHLLFRFIHVSCDSAGNPKEKISHNKRELESKVGYAWLPLLNSERNLVEGQFNLPVAINLNKNYLRVNGETSHGLTWVDGQKLLFSVHVRVQSTIYTSNLHLDRFFKFSHRYLKEIHSPCNKPRTLSSSTIIDTSTYKSRKSDSSASSSPMNGDSPFNSLPGGITDNTHKGQIVFISSGVDILTEKEGAGLLKSLPAMDLCSLLRFLPPLINQLIQVLTCASHRMPTEQVKSEIPLHAISAMVNLVSIITGRGPDRKVNNLPPELYKRNKRLLKAYVENVFDCDQVCVYRTQSVHHALVGALVDLINYVNPGSVWVIYRFMSNNWFFLQLINKSMVQYLHKCSKLKVDRSKDSRFQQAYQTDLRTLHNAITLLLRDMCLGGNVNAAQRVPPMQTTSVSTVSSNSGLGSVLPPSFNNLASAAVSLLGECREANSYLARFTARLFNIMDRGFVFSLIHNYILTFQRWDDELKSVDDREKLNSLRYDFLQEVCCHEHFVPLNLPLSCRSFIPDPRSDLYLTDHFCENHFLVGLLLQQIHQRLSDRSLSFSGRTYREPIIILRNHLAKHAFDDRYLNKASQARIAGLYVPLLSILLDHKRLFSLPGTFSSKHHQVSNSVSVPQGSQGNSLPQSVNASSSRSTVTSRPTSLLGTEATSLWSLSQRNGDNSSNMTSQNGSISSGSAVISDKVSIGSGSTISGSTGQPRGYLTKSGKVDQGVLEAIAGVGPGGSLQQRLRMRRTNTSTSGRNDATEHSGDLLDRNSITSNGTLKGIPLLDDTSSVDMDLNYSRGREATTPTPKSSEGQEMSFTCDINSAPPLASLEDEVIHGGDGLFMGSALRKHATSITSNTAKIPLDLDAHSLVSSGSWSAQVLSAAGVRVASKPQQTTGKHSMPSTLERRVRRRQAPCEPISHTLPDKSQRDLFLCMLHVVSSTLEEQFTQWLKNITLQNRLEFLELVRLSIHHMAYQGKKSISNFDKISSVGVMKARLSHIPSKRVPSQRIGYTSGFPDSGDANSESENANTHAALAGHLSTECGLIILDIIGLFSNVFRNELDASTSDSGLLSHIVDIYITFLRSNQSELLLKHMFPSMRVFISKFTKPLFAGTKAGEIVGDICFEVLQCCNSRISSIRMEACGLLYRLMLCSWNVLGVSGFNRVHIQMIVAVSKLVGVIDQRFENSLSHINMLAQRSYSVEQQHRRQTPPSTAATTMNAKPGLIYSSTTAANLQGTTKLFVDEVTDLTRRIRTVLMATAKMRLHENDPEMLVDLQYSLAKSYATNPVLRRTWLEEICANHEKNKASAEVAMVKIHIAALIAEFLRRRGHHDQGSKAFESISPNIPIEETGVREDSELLDVNYTLEDLKCQLLEAAKAFDEAGLYEVMVHVYRLLIPTYEIERNLSGLAHVYSHLASGYERAMKEESAGHRVFSMHYRVAFYGQSFDNLNGKVFIYVAGRCVELASFCHYLKQIFNGRNGIDQVELLMEAHVNRSYLQPTKSYIQVTSVQPFFTEEQLTKERKTRFERNYTLHYFSFETPFVPQPGRDHDSCLQGSGPKRTDDLSAQWKRRTILQTEMMFPHLRRRMEVIDVREIDLSPIEGALDALQEKIQQLNSHIQHTEFNKLMDMHLQGSLMVQVNQGPMAYAQAFLSPEARSKQNAENVKRLKLLFIQFLNICFQLLHKYRALMPVSMVQKYEIMRQTLDTYRVDLSNLLSEELVVDEEKKMIVSKSVAYLQLDDENMLKDYDSQI